VILIAQSKHPYPSGIADVGILRLRNTLRFANITPLRMTNQSIAGELGDYGVLTDVLAKLQSECSGGIPYPRRPCQM
jgi:hypothetical protein